LLKRTSHWRISDISVIGTGAGAEQEFRRALELDPGSFDAHIYYGTLLMHLGRHDEAIREGQIGVQLDPLSSPSQTFLGRFLYRARRDEEAVPHLKAGS
jgi:Tfp pilus assembly protein PilF